MVNHSQINSATIKTRSEQIVSIYEIGCFFGAVATFVFAEKLGRRKTIAIGAVFMAIGAAIQASSYTVAQLIVGRIVSGLGMGAINSTVPVLQAELARKQVEVVSSVLSYRL